MADIGLGVVVCGLGEVVVVMCVWGVWVGCCGGGDVGVAECGCV